MKRKKKNNKKQIKYNNAKSLLKKFDINTLPTKRYQIVLVFSIFILICLIVRIGYLQFKEGTYLKEKAYNQQTINSVITAKRGTIYDSTGKVLAISSQVDTVSVNPKKIVGSNDASTKEKREKLAKAFSEIFELDYNEVLEKLNSNNSVETIAKKVDNTKIDKLKEWMADNKISVGINIDEDSKRTYPYSNLASHVIGFCGNDNNGLQGIELKWNDVLSGTNGKVITLQDAFQEEIPDANEKYVAAENGSNLVLSIDVNIQSIMEKYLQKGILDNNCSNGGVAIAMNPSTGDILGMASYPNYNLNTPFLPNTESLSKTWDTLNSEDKTTALNQMWRNKVVSDTYEPGSTFKLITSAVALEENLTSEDNSGEFTCIGYEEINDIQIKCWRKEPHGSQTLRDALENSCNPAFIQLGKKIGASTLYKYYDAFGLFEKTGVSLPGESNSIFHKLDNVKNVELATMSFGQRINITPMQLITAISAISNGGELMQPRLVKEIVNTDTNSSTTIEPKSIRKVLSKKTSERMLELMRSVVDDGTGFRAQVAGYAIGGKTGTSEPISGKEDEGYVASFVAVSPTENPQICLLVALYDPKGKTHQGGQVCGPIVSNMLSEILPYIGLTSTDISNTTVSNENAKKQTVTVPDIRNKTLAEAKKILSQANLKYNYSVAGDENSLLVVDQTPSAGTTLTANSIICLYTEENTTRVSVTVPDLIGMTYLQAQSALNSKNLNITFEGSINGIVKEQNIKKDVSVEEGTVIKVTF